MTPDSVYSAMLRNPKEILTAHPAGVEEAGKGMTCARCEEKPTVGSLFSGIGGFDLGLERAGMKVLWQVEIDDYAQRVLTKHWPHVPKYGDIRAIDWGAIPRVDLLCGGFPCQDLSFAGKRAGIEGARSGLWGEYVRAIRALRPRYVLVENVPGLLTNAYMGRVLRDLAESGYDAEWDCIPASAFGGPHLRDRVYILAYPSSERRKESSIFVRKLSQDVKSHARDWNGRRVAQPAIQRMADGLPSELDRLRGLGNAVVPQIVEAIGKMIIEADKQRV
jgi:DNA (cytosine-5)-methyltransferase 1